MTYPNLYLRSVRPGAVQRETVTDTPPVSPIDPNLPPPSEPVETEEDDDDDTQASAPVRTEQEIDADGLWCEKHGMAYTAMSNDRGSWYSHRNGAGWCNARPPF